MFDLRRIARLDVLTRGALCLAAIVCLGAPFVSPLTLDTKDTGLPAAAFVLMVSVGVLYGPRHRNVPRLAAAATMSADLIAYALVLGTFAYLAAATPRPLFSAAFADADRMLGFDWLAYYRLIKSHPGLGKVISLAYDGMIVEVGLVAAALLIANDVPRLRILLDAFALCALLTIVVSGLFPAVEALAHFGIYPMVQKAQGYVTGIDRTDDFIAIHFGTMTTIPIMDSKGIVSFPSFHTACALITAVCAWHSRWLRWPFAIWSTLLIAATPVDGGHYLVDVIAGLVLSSSVLAAMFAYARTRRTATHLAVVVGAASRPQPVLTGF